MRDQGRIHGPSSSDPWDYVKRRFTDHDRKLDDLYRRLGDKPERAQPSGGTVDMMKGDVSTGSIAGGGGVTTLAWNVTSGSHVYTTPGITLTNSNTDINLPGAAGGTGYLFDLMVTVTMNTTAPTSGYVLYSLFNDSNAFDGAGGRQYYSNWPVSSATQTWDIGHQTIITSASTFSVTVRNFLNQPILVFAQISVAGTTPASPTFGS